MRQSTEAEPLRCERCRFTISEYASVECGWCACCRGVSSFVISPEQSEKNRVEFAEHVARLAERSAA